MFSFISKVLLLFFLAFQHISLVKIKRLVNDALAEQHDNIDVVFIYILIAGSSPGVSNNFFLFFFLLTFQ